MKTQPRKKRSMPETETKHGGFAEGLFKGLSGFIDLVDKLNEKGILERRGEFTVPGDKEMKGVYGFTMRTMAGPGGSRRPVVEHFGNIKKRSKGPVVEETREPIVDVFDEKEAITVVAEMPGVAHDEITFDIHGDVVELWTTGKRKYKKEILLPGSADETSATSSYNNGMFELKLKKKA